MSERAKLATVECPICLAWAEVYSGDAPPETRGDHDRCQHPPIDTCPYMHKAIRERRPAGIS